MVVDLFNTIRKLSVSFINKQKRLKISGYKENRARTRNIWRYTISTIVNGNIKLFL